MIGMDGGGSGRTARLIIVDRRERLKWIGGSILYGRRFLDNMSKGQEFQPPSLSEAELRSLLIQALEDAPGWKSQETFHARFHHLERGIDINDVIHAIQGSWKFERPPIFNEKEWQWKYRIAAQSLDEESLTIIVAVDTANRTFEVVTRWNT